MADLEAYFLSFADRVLAPWGFIQVIRSLLHLCKHSRMWITRPSSDCRSCLMCMNMCPMLSQPVSVMVFCARTQGNELPARIHEQQSLTSTSYFTRSRIRPWTVTSVCFESSLDCVAVKIPRGDLKKSSRVFQPLKQCEEHRRGKEKDIGRTFETMIRQLSG